MFNIYGLICKVTEKVVSLVEAVKNFVSSAKFDKRVSGQSNFFHETTMAELSYGNFDAKCFVWARSTVVRTLTSKRDTVSVGIMLNTTERIYSYGILIENMRDGSRFTLKLGA